MSRICLETEKKINFVFIDENSEVINCPHCDLEQAKKKIKPGQSLNCCRCLSTLKSRKPKSINRSLALSLAALVLFFPAALYPLITLKILGENSSANLLTGIKHLMIGGFPFIGMIVLFLSIIIPLFKLVSLTIVLLSITFNYKFSKRSTLFRLYCELDLWGMQEVYLLGILVALTKLDSLADVYIGPGFYTFVCLIIINLNLSYILDKNQVWQRIDNNG